MAKRILLLNSCPVELNGVGVGLARVLLEGPSSAFQIGTSRFNGASFIVGERERSFEFTVQRVGETLVPATVKFTTSAGTARAGIDYVAQAGILNFAPFETEKSVTVPLTGLLNHESRVFFVSLSEAIGASLSGQPPVPVIIAGKPLVPGKITPLRLPDGGIALIFGELLFEFESHSLIEVSSDLKTWLPSTGYRFGIQIHAATITQLYGSIIARKPNHGLYAIEKIRP